MEKRASDDELRRRIANGSRDVDDFRALAGSLTDAGEIATAIGLLEQGLAVASGALDRASVAAQLAWLLYERTTDVERARTVAQDALGHLTGEPETADLLFIRGLLQFVLARERFDGDLRAGMEMARAAIATLERLFSEATDWDDEEAWLAAADLYCFVGDGERAIPFAQRFLRVPVDENRRLRALFTLAEAQRLAGALQEAEGVASEAMSLARDHPDSLHIAAHLLGLIQKESGRLTDARTNFERARSALDSHGAVVKKDPFWRKAVHGRLAEVYTALGAHDKAISEWQELLSWYADDDGDRPRIMLCLAHACDAADSLTAARRWYESVLAAPLASSEDRAEARVWLLWAEGRLQHERDEYEQAARTFERLLEHYRDDDADRRSVLRWLGDSYDLAGEFDEAMERYGEIADSPRAAPEEKTRARLRAEQSSARNDFEAGRYVEAARSLEGIVNRVDNRCYWLLWLAACYVRLGRNVDARRCYEEVLNAPDATEKEQARARRSLAALESA